MSHSVALSGLSANTLYHFKVESKDAAGNLSSSGDFMFTTLVTPDITAPIISLVASSSISNTGATITWTTDENASSKVMYGATASYGSETALDSNMVMSHSAVLVGLTANTTYHYQVRSVDAAGNVALSADYMFTTSNNDVTAPIISNISASSISSSGAIIMWNTDENASSQVSYGLTGTYGADTTLDSNLMTAHAQALTGLSANTTYHYQAKSVDASGNAAASLDYIFTTSI